MARENRKISFHLGKLKKKKKVIVTLSYLICRSFCHMKFNMAEEEDYMSDSFINVQ